MNVGSVEALSEEAAAGLWRRMFRSIKESRAAGESRGGLQDCGATSAGEARSGGKGAVVKR